MECGYHFRLGVSASEVPAERRRDFHQWAAEEAQTRGKHHVAERHLMVLWQFRPQDWNIGTRLAYVQEAQGAFERALDTWHRIMAAHQAAEAREGYVACALRFSRTQESQHAFDQAIETCRQAMGVVGDDERLRYEAHRVSEAKAACAAQEREYARDRRSRAQTTTVASGFGVVTGAVVMVAGILLMMLGLAMVPCCIGIFILPVAFSVFAAGIAMMVGAPAGGVAVYTIGELPRAIGRFAQYRAGLSAEHRRTVTVAIAIGLGLAFLLLFGLALHYLGG